MNINEYQQLAIRTLNKDVSDDKQITNGVMGLCGESGECCDIVKKYLFQGHELNRGKLIEELGDVAWYLACTAFGLGIELEEVFKGNVEKLKKRYPEGFTEERSVNRDKYGV